MKDLSERIARVEGRLGTGEDQPLGPVRVHVSERSFATVTDLKAWQAQRERQDREQARACALAGESESLAAIGFTVIRICKPGEQPSARELGVRTLGPLAATLSDDVPS